MKEPMTEQDAAAAPSVPTLLERFISTVIDDSPPWVNHPSIIAELLPRAAERG